MTKQEFVDAVAGKTGLTKRDAGAAVDAVLDVVTERSRPATRSTFTGFGKFHTTQAAARMGVNPRNPSQKVHIARRPCRSSRPARSSRRPSTSDPTTLLRGRTRGPPSGPSAFSPVRLVNEHMFV